MLDQARRLDDRLDRVEEQLPPLAAAGLRLQRSLASRSCEMANELAKTWFGALGGTAKRVGDATSTVTGTARSAGRQAADSIDTSLRQVAGQAEAQSSAVAERAENELAEVARTTEETVTRSIADATRAVEAATVAADPDRTPTGDVYEDMTKAQLYRRAADLDIDGRSRMSKDELLAAVLDHQRLDGGDDRG